MGSALEEFRLEDGSVMEADTVLANADLSYVYQHLLPQNRYNKHIVRKGDRLLLWGENCPEWIVVFWASLARGVQVVPVDFRSSHRLVQRIQKEVGAKLLVHSRTVAWEQVKLRRIPFDEIARLDEAGDFESTEIHSDDVVEILYTSGTTGEPKGVVHRHRNMCSNLNMFQREIARYKPIAFPFQPIRILDMLPLSHMFGQSLGIFFPVLLESSVVFLSELHPGILLSTIRRERVSVLVSVPRLLANLRQEIERRFTLPAKRGRQGLLGAAGRWWRTRHIHSAFGWKFWAVVVGGARLPPEEEEFLWRMGWVVVQGYGLTETSPIVATNHPLRPHRGSIGRVVEGQEVKIAPDGEILVRGESVVNEYYGSRPDSSTKFQDGWLHTGDIGEKDDEGRLYYRGRKKDVIVTSDGLNVYPQDIESVLRSRPEIKDSLILGLPFKGGEKVHAVLLLSAPAVDLDGIMRHVNGELESHQRIQSWSVWPAEDFPRTPSTFKIKRGEVKKQLLECQGESRENEQTVGLLPALAGLSGKRPRDIREDWRLSEDLGLTSLDRIELLSRLENDYGIDLDEDRFNELSTVEEIKAYIHKEPASKPLRASGLPRWPRVFPVPWIRHAVLRLIAIPLWHRYIDFSLEGLEHLSDLKPPLIFAANHSSHLDTIAILAGLPFRWRRLITPAMQKEHFRAHFDSRGFNLTERIGRTTQYALACGLVNAYPLPHEMAGVRRALEFTGELVQAGYCPLVYPEGERTPTGEMSPFKPGIGLMAVRLRVPVVPIHLEGMFRIYSVHDSWPHRGAIRMRMGPPRYFEEGRGYEDVAKTLEEAVRKLGND